MNGMSFIKLWVVLSVWGMFFPNAGVAGNIRLGRLQVEPQISYRMEYNNNIFLDASNKQDDFIHTLKPGITLKYEGAAPGNEVSGGYFINYSAYSRFNENNYWSHNPFVSARIRTPFGLYAQVDENFLYTADPYGTQNQYNEGIKTRRWNNSAGVTAGYKFAQRYSIEGSYRNTIDRFDADIDKWQDLTSHQMGVAFLYNLTGKTSVFGQYRKTLGEYPKQNDGVLGWSSATSQDYSQDSYFLGFRFEPGGKLSGEAKFGFGTKKFDHEFDKFDRRYEDETGWIAETVLDYQMFERTLLSANLQRSFKGSPDPESSSYTDTLAELAFRHIIRENRYAITGSISWENMDYSNENTASPRKYFNLYGARLGFEWQFLKWFMAVVEYSYKDKVASNSYYALEEYSNHVFGISINARF